MPPTKVLFYNDRDGHAPVPEWLAALRKRDRLALERCVRAVQSLAREGHELRRPHTDYLRDGIYELRVKCGRVNYRLLYFFQGQNVAVVAAALAKEGRIPDIEIRRALDRKRAFTLDPEAHAHTRED